MNVSTGAGDVFFGGLAYSIVKGVSLGILFGQIHLM